MGFEYLVLGGYFLAGAAMTPANLLFLLGCAGLAAGRRLLALLSGVGALALGGAGVVPLALACDVLAFPAYWVWMASFAVLLVGASRLPRVAA
jgi:hypothetical protein